MKITEIVHDAPPDIKECLECIFNDIIDVTQFYRQPKRRRVDRGKSGNTSSSGIELIEETGSSGENKSISETVSLEHDNKDLNVASDASNREQD
jgi:hypothetical protein